MQATSRPRGPSAATLARNLGRAVACGGAIVFTLSACTIPTDDVVTAAEPAAPAPRIGSERGVTGTAGNRALVGKTVFLDPGHSGSHDAAITAQVPTGRGGTKDCQTTGTSTATGYPEHTFTWQVAGLMRTELEFRGARVEMSRPDDTSVGSCVDERAATANASGADAVVAIHADGADTDDQGFHVSYSAPPLNDVQAGASVEFAETMRDALVDRGLVPATYIGDDGLLPRSDLAGLNLSQRPSILVELGNMRNPLEAVQMTDDAGRERYALAVVHGIAEYLGGS